LRFLVCIADVTDHQSCTHQSRVSLRVVVVVS
jgi:hypothetical protein